MLPQGLASINVVVMAEVQVLLKVCECERLLPLCLGLNQLNWTCSGLLRAEALDA